MPTSGRGAHATARRQSQQAGHATVENVGVPNEQGVRMSARLKRFQERVREMTYRAGAVMADLDELFVHEFNTPEAGRLEELDLRLDEEIKRDLGHKQAWARAGGVPDCGTDVLVFKRLRGIDVRKRTAKDVVENVVDPRAAGKLFCRNVNVRTLDGRDKVAGELRHEPEDECTLLCDAAVRLESKMTRVDWKDEPD